MHNLYYNGFMKPAQDKDSFGILEVLLSSHKIDSVVFEEAKKTFVKSGTDPLRYLLDKNLVGEEDLVRARAVYYNIGFVSLREKAASPVALGYIDKATATRLMLIPFEYDPAGRELRLAM